MTISLRARFGGLAGQVKGLSNWKKSSARWRKNLTLQAMETPIPPASLLGGNYESLPAWETLYRNEFFYSLVRGLALRSRATPVTDSLQRELSLLPDSFSAFQQLSSDQIERLSGAAMLLAHHDRCLNGKDVSCGG